ncbi:MAG TPA: hypothetical protein VI199_09595 [Novosphingobium sp.]
MAEARRAWFHPRRYGWGWGAPATWQGWATLILFIVSLVAARRFVFRPFGAVPYFCTVAALVAALVVACWWSSGPPRWRWGDRD